MLGRPNRSLEQIDTARLASRLGLYEFYRDQLRKFYTLGIGNKTENGVIVTDLLIGATTRRLHQLGAK